jgi:hypothetical protein
VTQAAAWGFEDIVVWGSMRTKDESRWMSQTLVGLRDFVAETGLT